MPSELEIPIFPLGSLLYPAGRLSLHIFEQRYVDMTRACIRDNSVFGVTLIRAGYEVGVPAIPHDVGCTARIIDWEEPVPDQFMLEARGESVFQIDQRWTLPSGLIVARIILRDPPDPVPLPQRYETLRSMLAGFMERRGAEYFPRPQRLDDAAWVGNRLCELLPVPPERKQKLLEERDPLAVLAKVEQLLNELREDDA